MTRSTGGGPFYGWWAILPAVFLLLLVTNGLTTGGIAAFDPTLIRELGVSRADIKFGDLLQLGITAVMSVLTGWLADRWGVRIVMLIGLLILAWGFQVLAGVASLQDYYASRLWMGTGLAGAGVAVSVVAVSRWFVLRRGLALGIVLAGTSLGNALAPWLFTRLIGAHGWQAAAAYGVWSLLAMIIVIAAAVREWPENLGLRPWGAAAVESVRHAPLDAAGAELGFAQILARREFWLMGLAAFATFYAILGVNNNMILHMQVLGVRPEIGALIAMPLFFAGLVGKLGAGWLTDLIGRKLVWLVSIALMAVATLGLASMSAALVPVAAIVMGLGWGANYTLLQAVAGDIFGARSLGRVMGAVTLLDAGGGALGPWVTARLADSTGTYRAGFLLIGVLLAFALACASLLRIATPDVQVRRA
ncbi:MAG: MFS transporter [Steroidobacteraceae bacterium]